MSFGVPALCRWTAGDWTKSPKHYSQDCCEARVMQWAAIVVFCDFGLVGRRFEGLS